MAALRARGIVCMREALQHEGLKVVELAELPDGERAHMDFCTEDAAMLAFVPRFICEWVLAAVGKDGYVALVPIARADASITAYTSPGYEEGDTFMRCVAVKQPNPFLDCEAFA